jgi:NAD(P)-dependent dehydrogenase (short-subunit alcohol dehydrogenase family)
MVTGANTGLGFATAKVLARRGARVLLGCRSSERAEAAMVKLVADTPDADLAFIELDQGNLASVRAAAEAVCLEPRLDVLVNNAGIMMPPYQLTDDGFESQFGVNHLGTFALTALLLDKLGEQSGSRVVSTSSIAHRKGQIFFGDIDASSSYKAQERYQQSKLANLLFMYELDRRLRLAGSNTISVACHPGIADPDLARHLPGALRLITPLLRPFFNTSAAGAWPTLMAATAPEVAGGQYFGPSQRGETAGPAKEVDSTPTSKNPGLADKLWELSIEMTAIVPPV